LSVTDILVTEDLQTTVPVTINTYQLRTLKEKGTATKKIQQIRQS